VPPDQSRLDQDAAAGRGALGEAAFEAAWAEGCAMSLDQAVAFALRTEEPPSPRRVAGARRPPDRLTPREREVAGLVAQGLTNREVAEHLIVSERTVDTHVEHIRNRLRLRSRAQIAAWAVAHGLAPAPPS
jgi:DNA-binding NarL/FixJ family response regulator